MHESEGHEIGFVRHLLRESQQRAQRQREMAAAMERVGDRHGATIARELLRIELATLRLARERLRRLEQREPGLDHGEAAG